MMGRIFKSLLPDQWHVGLAMACLIAVPLAIFASFGWGVAHRDYVRADHARGELFRQIHDPQTGYLAKLSSAERERDTATRMISEQSARIADWAAAAEIRKAETTIKVQQAQASVRAAEREVQRLLSMQPRDGESRCEAAYRLIQEQAQ